ncbi:MAG TPA: hypothetical protein VIB79_15995 [Candidatus Binatia bacterium]|jgi:hypothetical protein
MTGKVVPARVEEFLLSHIDSVAQLEGLLLLRNEPEKRWTTEAIARRLYLSVDQTEPLLRRLAMQDLIGVDQGAAAYHYQPKTEDIRELIDELAEIYRKHLVAVTNLIHAKPRSRVQEFADAFKFRKDD